MKALAHVSICSLLAGVLLATSGCVLAPGRDNGRGYDHDRIGYQRDGRYRDEDRDRDRETPGRVDDE
jgi:hypothetical protein